MIIRIKNNRSKFKPNMLPLSWIFNLFKKENYKLGQWADPNLLKPKLILENKIILFLNHS